MTFSRSLKGCLGRSSGPLAISKSKRRSTASAILRRSIATAATNRIAASAYNLSILATIFRESGFKVFRGALDSGGVVKAINAKGFAEITIGQADELTEIAKLYGAKGLAFIKIENGEWKSPIVKFFSEAEKAALQSKLNFEEG